MTKKLVVALSGFGLLLVGAFGLTASASETAGTLLVCQDQYTSALKAIDNPEQCPGGVVWEIEGELYQPVFPPRS